MPERHPLREAAQAVVTYAAAWEDDGTYPALRRRIADLRAALASPAAPRPESVIHAAIADAEASFLPAAPRPEGPNHDGHTPHDPPAYLYDAALTVVSTYRGGTGAPTEATLSARALAVARLEAVLHDMERPAAVPPEGLDVERLAAAICNGEASRYPGSPRWDRFSEEGRDLFRKEARDLFREYQRLSDTGDTCQHMIPADECRVVGCRK